MGKMVVFHHNDPDGHCAGAIAYRYGRQRAKFSDIVLIECDHGQNISLDVIQPGDTVVIVDFSFKPDQMQKIIKVAGKQHVIWCDHHVTAKDYGYDNIPGKRDFEDKGYAGCECTWLYFYPEVSIPPAVTLVGDYDAWRLQHKEDSLAFFEGLKLLDTRPMSAIWEKFLYPSGNSGVSSIVFAGCPEVEEVIDNGRLCMRYRDAICSRARRNAYETEIDGHRAIAFNISGYGSQAFGPLFDEYPYAIAYSHNGDMFTATIYSKHEDASVIAKKFGGGGHKGAAGFRCKELPFRKKVSQ